MADSSQWGGRRRKAAALLVAGVVAAGAVVVGGVKLTEAWQGKPFPAADPAGTARHLDDRTQVVYDALALPAGPTINQGQSRGIKANIYDCHLRGLAHALENMQDTAPHEPRAAAVSAGWTLTGLARPQALDAIQRARQTLTQQGWTVAAYKESDLDIRLKLTPPSTGPGSVSDTVYIDFYNPSGFFEVDALAECAHYLDDTPVDSEGKPENLPYPTAPTQLRRQ